jgi:hypothetical protein
MYRKSMAATPAIMTHLLIAIGSIGIVPIVVKDGLPINEFYQMDRHCSNYYCYYYARAASIELCRGSQESNRRC